MLDDQKLKYKFSGEDDDEVEETEEYDDDEDTGGREIAVSYACEDCDYRWEIYLEDDDEDLDEAQYCPMCGSANTSQI